MLPPVNVPAGLSYPEYLKLNLRYMSMGLMRQSMGALHQATLLQPHSDMPDDNRKRALLLFDAAEKALFLQEVSDDMKKTFGGFFDYTLGEVDKKLDKFEPVKKAKDGLKNVFSLVSQTVSETVDGSLEHHLLPALGMPLDAIPEDRLAEEYLILAGKYNQIGACEPARECLSKIISMEGESPLSRTAKVQIKTQLPRHVVPHDAMLKYMSALRYLFTQKEEKAKEQLVDLEVKFPRFELPMVQLASIALKNREEVRARHLLDAALKINGSLSKAWCLKARLAISEWKLSEMDSCIEKLTELDPNDPGLQALLQMQAVINNGGLRA